MMCVICKTGETHPGTATVTLDREGTAVVIKGVPARVCKNCGEEYVDESVTARLLKTAEEAFRAGVQVDVRTTWLPKAGARLSCLFGFSGLCGFFSSKNETNQIDQANQPSVALFSPSSLRTVLHNQDSSIHHSSFIIQHFVPPLSQVGVLSQMEKRILRRRFSGRPTNSSCLTLPKRIFRSWSGRAFCPRGSDRWRDARFAIALGGFCP